MWNGFIWLWTGTSYSFHNEQGTSSLATEILASENNSAPWTQLISCYSHFSNCLTVYKFCTLSKFHNIHPLHLPANPLTQSSVVISCQHRSFVLYPPSCWVDRQLSALLVPRLYYPDSVSPSPVVTWPVTEVPQLARPSLT